MDGVHDTRFILAAMILIILLWLRRPVKDMYLEATVINLGEELVAGNHQVVTFYSVSSGVMQACDLQK